MNRILFQLFVGSALCLADKARHLHESEVHSVLYDQSERCNQYPLLNRRNSKLSLTVDSLIDSFFYFSSAAAVSYNVKLTDLEAIANRTIKPFCEEEIYNDYQCFKRGSHGRYLSLW